MSGHSHWSKIKRAKGSSDSKRSQQWSKLSKRIIIAAKHGGGKPEENLQLRYAIDDAKAVNMPNDTIARAIKKGTGELETVTYEEIVYEGYGPGGVAFMVVCLTDNRSRTAPELRKIFERGGGQLGGTGCVSWMFDKKGTFIIPADATTEEALMEVALEAGAEDITSEAEEFTVTCELPAFDHVKQALAKHNIKTLSAERGMVPKNTVAIDAEKARKALHLMEILEDHDDVENVYANFDIPEEVAAELKA
ncbi:MAG: YebC/PmpR family DNA-binding transcriptional regulator [Planctomycetaceae bacterium]|nr:YebC/PmpR family DNA-binding transcriptional regulator [Planctomycetaceae bacterium]